MSVIQRQIEAQGVSTVSISLFRPFTEKVQPPRAVWVPFPFGRALGAPNNKDIQRKVIFAAFDLFKRESGPVLEDLVLSEAEEHLDARNQKVGQKCGPKGCNFDDAMSTAEEVLPREIAPYSRNFADVCEEIQTLREHHATYMQKYGGRPQIGYSGVTADTIWLSYAGATQNLLLTETYFHSSFAGAAIEYSPAPEGNGAPDSRSRFGPLHKP